MQPAERAQIGQQVSPGPPERPWLFNFLIAPDAVITLGLVTGALSYLLRNEGIDPGRAASIVALLAVPHAIYFLWGPVTDFWLRRRTWLMLAAAAAAAIFAVAFHQKRLGSAGTVGLMFLGACVAEFTVAACGGIMGTLRSEANRRRAGSFYQSGSLAFGGVAVFLLVSLAQRISLGGLGWILAAMIVLPSFAALATPARQPRSEPRSEPANELRNESRNESSSEEDGRETAARIWREFRATFLRWEAAPYTVLILAPASSGAMIGLLPSLARNYGVSGQQVAWINGLAGALLMAAGAVSVSLIPARVRAPIAFQSAGLLNAVPMAILALGPARPAVYFTGTLLFLFTIGAGYALFTGVALEFMGNSGKSGGARYSIINSLGNLPVAYMAYIDGRSYAHWGPRAMPAADAIVSAAGAVLLLVYFGRRSGRPPVCSPEAPAAQIGS